MPETGKVFFSSPCKAATLLSSCHAPAPLSFFPSPAIDRGLLLNSDFPSVVR